MKNFTRILFATLLLAVFATGAKAEDTTLWENYSPNGEKFIKENVSINFNTQSLVAVLDLTNCTETNENILSIGQNIDLWGNNTSGSGNVIHIYRKAASTVNVWCFDNHENKVHNDAISVSDQSNVTITLNSNGLYVDDKQIVTAEQCPDILALTTIAVGSQEGNTRSKATYKSVKVVDNATETDSNKPVIGETYYIVPASNTSKGLYVKDDTETTTLITVGTLTEDTKYQWELFKSPYSTSLLYFNCFKNVFSGYGLDANSSHATDGNPCQWRIEGSESGQYSNANVNQDFDLVAVGDGTYKMAVSSSGTTYYLKWNGTDETLSLTTIFEDATPFWFKNVKTTTFEKEVTLDETSENNTSTIAALTSGTTYTFNIKRTLKADTWSTIVLPFAVSAEQVKEVFGSDVVVARFSGFNQTTLGFQKVDTIGKGQPCIIKISADAADNYDSDKGWAFKGITSWTSQPVDVEQNGISATMTSIGAVKFHGTFNKTQVVIAATSYGKYALGTDNKIYHLTKTTDQKGFRAIFEEQFGDSSNAKFDSWSLDGDVTAIDAIDGQAAPVQPQNVYNLNGQLVKAGATTIDALPKGVYIIGGKKVVKK